MNASARIVPQINLLTAGCWEWPGGRTPDGYGRIGIGGKVRPVHRVFYEEQVGPVPDGMVLDHLCRNRACLRPDHLEPVTPSENTMRGESFAALNARKTTCPKGHEFTPDNTYIHTNKKGMHARHCRACSAANQRAYAARKAARAASGGAA